MPSLEHWPLVTGDCENSNQHTYDQAQEEGARKASCMMEVSAFPEGAPGNIPWNLSDQNWFTNSPAVR